MKTSILSGLFVLLSVSLARAAPLKPKFDASLSGIRSELQGYVSGQVDTTTLSQGSLRQILFSIQTMASLYSSKYPVLENVRVATKSLEDGIGNFRKTIEQLDYAQAHAAPAETLAQLQDRVTRGELTLKSQLQNEKWTDLEKGELFELQNEINSIRWDEDLKEQNDTYMLLANQLTTIDQTPWNMTVLEGGVGVHDLRKQVRWYKLEVEALSDLIATDATTCPAPVKKPSATDARCVISDCLNVKMTEVYNTFGAAKDQGEGEDGLGHGITQDILKPAQDLYTQITNDHLFQNLAHEFKQCVQEQKAP